MTKSEALRRIADAVAFKEKFILRCDQISHNAAGSMYLWSIWSDETLICSWKRRKAPMRWGSIHHSYEITAAEAIKAVIEKRGRWSDEGWENSGLKETESQRSERIGTLRFRRQKDRS